jgi:ubiquinone biosynthesis monooxygenase Coq7
MLDEFLLQIDRGVRTVGAKPTPAQRPRPDRDLAMPELSARERSQSAGLMRVNHAGETSAQALYYGQAVLAREPGLKDTLHQAAQEENDHLDWCAERLKELDSHTSYLGALWYAGSFGFGLLAGLAGDRWSLGFVAETERQVGKHLAKHLERLPADDAKSRAILEQMQRDEAHHATMAMHAGAAELPQAVRQLMSVVSKLMTTTAYWV